MSCPINLRDAAPRFLESYCARCKCSARLRNEFCTAIEESIPSVLLTLFHKMPSLHVKRHHSGLFVLKKRSVSSEAQGEHSLTFLAVLFPLSEWGIAGRDSLRYARKNATSCNARRLQSSQSSAGTPRPDKKLIPNIAIVRCTDTRRWIVTVYNLSSNVRPRALLWLSTLCTVSTLCTASYDDCVLESCSPLHCLTPLPICPMLPAFSTGRMIPLQPFFSVDTAVDTLQLR